MNAPRKAGPLVIIGGAEDKEGQCTILREFLRLAGGKDAHLAILTAATDYPEEVGHVYTDLFTRLGAASVEMVDTRYRDDAEKPELVDIIDHATGIFFSGGDQAQIIDCIKDTRMDQAIRQRHQQGAVVGGTSAGAAIMPARMIVEGESETNPRLDVVEMGPGMGFLPGIVLDQHFAQRGRLGRLLSALLIDPSVVGFGIDENTAIVVQGDDVRVIGEGAVTVVDESESPYNNLKTVLQDEDLAVYGVRLHILPQGHHFNLTTRQPQPPANQQKGGVHTPPQQNIQETFTEN